MVRTVVDEQQVTGEGLSEGNPLGVSGAPDHFFLVTFLDRFVRHDGKVLMPFRDPFGIQKAVPERKCAGCHAGSGRCDTVAFREKRLQLGVKREADSVLQPGYITVGQSWAERGIVARCVLPEPLFESTPQFLHVVHPVHVIPAGTAELSVPPVTVAIRSVDSGSSVPDRGRQDASFLRCG